MGKLKFDMSRKHLSAIKLCGYHELHSGFIPNDCILQGKFLSSCPACVLTVGSMYVSADFTVEVVCSLVSVGTGDVYVVLGCCAKAESVAGGGATGIE